MNDGTAKDLAVVILTSNEEANIAQVLDSVTGWARQVLILDSFSKDRTLEIAARYPCSIHQWRFDNYAKQRNYALDDLPIETEWVMFLDADEWVPPALKHEITTVIEGGPVEDGFFIKRRFIWMGSWLKHGYYPTWLMRLFRRGKAHCEDRPVGEHFVVQGRVGYLQNDFIHEDLKGIGEWVRRHNNYAAHEATLTLKGIARKDRQMDAKFLGNQAQRKRWLRRNVWDRMPLLVRPFLYFVYRYVLCGGWLDGSGAFTYHFLQALWFPMLIDIKYLEARRKEEQSDVRLPGDSPGNRTATKPGNARRQ